MPRPLHEELLKLINLLEDIEDVHNVFTNTEAQKLMLLLLSGQKKDTKDVSTEIDETIVESPKKEEMQQSFDEMHLIKSSFHDLYDP